MTDLRALAERRLGSTLCGKWTLEAVLGVGGCAAVYRARHIIGRADAIKILHPDLADDPHVRARFEQEARAANRFAHPGAVEIRDMDVAEDGSPFLVMELLEGESLRQRVERLGPRPVDEVLRWMADVLDVLADAHAGAIVHRDIKPDNIFLCHDGSLKLLDFGIARIVAEAHRTTLSRQGAVIGTAGYMPPEQIRGAEVDGRADIFGVGAVMFRLLANRRIHTARGEVELLVKMATEPAPRLGSVAPDLPAEVGAIVDRALEFDRRARYPDARTMQRDLCEVMAGHAPPFASHPAPTLESTPAGLPASRYRPVPDARGKLCGKVLGAGYRLERLIGQGGMGAVYEARAEDGRRVAVKVIGTEWLARSPDARARFEREARAVEHIDSPHVVRVLDAGTDEAEGHPYIVMELLEGLDLEQLLSLSGPVDPAPAARLFRQACAGLAAAHARDIVHRDIKPGNLLLSVDRAGEVTLKVCDFGAAKSIADDAQSSVTKTGGMLGTLLYVSPEQAKNAKRVDVRADIWSLCMSLHQTLSGQRPWPDCEAQGELILAICTEPVPDLCELAPWVAPGLAAVVHRGLERDAAERWQTVGELSEALAPYAGDGRELSLDSLLSRNLGAAARSSVAGACATAAGPSQPPTRVGAPHSLAGIGDTHEPDHAGVGRGSVLAVLAAALVAGGVASYLLLSGDSPGTVAVGGAAEAASRVAADLPAATGSGAPAAASALPVEPSATPPAAATPSRPSASAGGHAVPTAAVPARPIPSQKPTTRPAPTPAPSPDTPPPTPSAGRNPILL